MALDIGKAQNILTNYWKSNKNYAEKGMDLEFKKEGNDSIFSQKSDNFYKALGSNTEVTDPKTLKEMFNKLLNLKAIDIDGDGKADKSIDQDGDGVLDVNEAADLCAKLQDPKFLEDNKLTENDKNILTNAVSFVVGSVAAQGANISELKGMTPDIFKTDTRGELKSGDSANNVMTLGQNATTKNNWDGNHSNFDYLIYSGENATEVNKALESALSDGEITQDEVISNSVLTKLFRERNLKPNEEVSSYKNVGTSGYNSDYWYMDKNGDGKLSQEEVYNLVNSNSAVKTAFGYTTAPSVKQTTPKEESPKPVEVPKKETVKETKLETVAPPPKKVPDKLIIPGEILEHSTAMSDIYNTQRISFNSQISTIGDASLRSKATSIAADAQEGEISYSSASSQISSIVKMDDKC